MAHYVDGFVVPVPRCNLEAYRRLAAQAGQVWIRHGALQYGESVADDVKAWKVMAFAQSAHLENEAVKDDEVVVFSWIVYHSRDHRDRVHANADDETAPFLARVHALTSSREATPA